MAYGTMIMNSIIRKAKHTVGSMFFNDIDLYCWLVSLKIGKKRFAKIQDETNLLANLLIATGCFLKPENCFWYLLYYTYVEGVWEPTGTAGCKCGTLSDSGAPTTIFSLVPH